MSTSIFIRKKRATKWFLLAGILIVPVGVLAFFRIHQAKDLDAYYVMSEQGHPIWKELAMRHVREGDSVKDLLSQVPATSEVRFGSSALFFFESGGVTCATASRDGRIVSAEMWSPLAKFSFFDNNDVLFSKDMSAFAKKQSEDIDRLRGHSG